MMRAIYTPSISTHAYERFCRRVGPATCAQIDEFILTDEMRDWLSWGVTQVKNYRGLMIAADRGRITTILSNVHGEAMKNYHAYHPDRERDHERDPAL